MQTPDPHLLFRCHRCGGPVHHDTCPRDLPGAAIFVAVLVGALCTGYWIVRSLIALGGH